MKPDIDGLCLSTIGLATKLGVTQVCYDAYQPSLDTALPLMVTSYDGTTYDF